MTRTLVGTLVLLALAPALRALDEPKKPPTPAEQVRALEREFREQQQAFQKAYQEAKTQEEKQKVFEEKYPRPDKFAPRFLAVAEKNPKNPVAVDALIWVVRNSPRQAGRDSPRTKAIELLRTNHIRSEKLAAVCSSLGYSPDSASQKLLREAIQKSPHRAVRGTACLALAQNLKEQIDIMGRIRDQPRMAQAYEQSLGKESVEALKKQDPDKVAKEVESLFKRVAAKYADLTDPRQRKMGDVANKELYEIRNLAVGKVAPDITGEDIDGKKFRLSDYRGKVVLLDFWGNW
jgi:hypothetical protein